MLSLFVIKVKSFSLIDKAFGYNNSNSLAENRLHLILVWVTIEDMLAYTENPKKIPLSALG